ncbi:MAG: VWA domain-containing protein [Phycisphaerales bacterium]
MQTHGHEQATDALTPAAPPDAPDAGFREAVASAVPTPPPEEDTLTTLLPWGVSFLLHAGLVLLALFVVWSTVMLTSDEKIIIPTARLSATPGAPLQIKETPRLKADPVARRTVSPLRNKQPVQMLTQPVSDASLVGVLGSSGDANPFEATLSGGGELRAQFLGSGGNARRIAFVIDASGSLIDNFPFVIQELRRSITQLSGRQQFTVIFYQGDQVIEVPPLGIDAKRATAAIKQQVMEWLADDQYNVTPKGTTNPVKALRRAFQYEPQLVFLLSDAITGQGQYEIDQRQLLNEIEKANRSGTKINTIQFIQEDPLVKAGLAPTMKLIADQSGGVYKYVPESELNK